MRLLLQITLILLFLLLLKAHMSSGPQLRGPCESLSLSEAAVSLLLSPLSLFSWSSGLLRLVLSVPVLVLVSMPLLLLLAGPCCVLSACVSLLLACLHAALYLLHLALVLWVAAILALTPPKMAGGDVATRHLRRKREGGTRR